MLSLNSYWAEDQLHPSSMTLERVTALSAEDRLHKTAVEQHRRLPRVVAPATAMGTPEEMNSYASLGTVVCSIAQGRALTLGRLYCRTPPSVLAIRAATRLGTHHCPRHGGN